LSRVFPGFVANPWQTARGETMAMMLSDPFETLLNLQQALDAFRASEPVYSEYNIGHYARAFTLSDKIDQDGISAELEDGVLTLTLKKSKEALLRRIALR
jgi:HSP20 family molecular chaperone IbpA